MPIAQHELDQEKSLLDLLYKGTDAVKFPAYLFGSSHDSIKLDLLFEEAERTGLGGKRLLFFVALSLALYENMGVSTPWAMILHDFFKKEDLEELYKEFYANFLKQSQISFKEEQFSFKCNTSDIRKEFTKGISQGRVRWGEALKVQRDQDVDELFSRMFAPGQCEIIRKILHDEELSKTERETFSRVVKKKLVAVIDPELQRVARVLTGTGWKKRKAKESASDLKLVRKQEGLALEG